MPSMPDRICGGLNCNDVVKWTRDGWSHAKRTYENRKHPPLPGELIPSA